MRKLTSEEIERFASSTNAQSEVVRSVLITINSESSTNLHDLFFQARMQGWRRATLTAILDGISHAATPTARRRSQKVLRPERDETAYNSTETRRPTIPTWPIAILRNVLHRAKTSLQNSQPTIKPHHPHGAVLGMRELREIPLTPIATRLKPEEK